MTASNHGRGIDAAFEQRLIRIVEDALAAASTPGAAVALLLDGAPVLSRGIGASDLAGTQPIGGDVQFYIYSVTKTLVAAEVLLLTQRGLIDLDAPIQGYLPDLALDTAVPVRRLLNHTGGIPDYGGLKDYYEAIKAHPREPWTAADFLRATLPRGLAFAPGEGWGYSNIGYLLLRRLIEERTRGSLAAALERDIFKPLDLRRTLVASSLEDSRLLTPGYSLFFAADDPPRNVAPVYHPGWVSHGVVISTAGETARIFEALLGGRLLPERLLAAMVEPVLVPVQHPLFRQPAYGLGLMIDNASPHGRLVGHGGGGPGYSAAALHLTTIAGRRITSVALANRDQDEVALRIAHALAGMLAEALPST